VNREGLKIKCKRRFTCDSKGSQNKRDVERPYAKKISSLAYISHYITRLKIIILHIAMSIFQSLYCTNQHYKITYGNYNIHSIGLYSMPLQCIVGAYVMGLFYCIVNG